MRGGAVVVVEDPLMRVGFIGRFTPRRDATIGAIVDRATRRGHDVVVLDIARLISGPVAFSPGTGHLILGDVELDLDTLDLLWLGPLPSASARLAPDDAVMSARDFDVLQKRQAARHALGWSIALCAEARGVPVLSSPSRARPFDHKPFQLAALHAAGLPVPRTWVTDGRSDDEDGIIKPVIGGRVRRAADGVVTPGDPQLWQPRLRGIQTRIAVVGGHGVGGYTVLVGEDDEVDSRLIVAPQRRFIRDEDMEWQLMEFAGKVARVCHYDVCTVDLIGRADTIVDVNRTPQLLDVCEDDDRVIRACLELIEDRGR